MNRFVAFWPARATASACANRSSRAARAASAWACRSSALCASARGWTSGCFGHSPAALPRSCSCELVLTDVLDVPPPGACHAAGTAAGVICPLTAIVDVVSRVMLT